MKHGSPTSHLGRKNSRNNTKNTKTANLKAFTPVVSRNFKYNSGDSTIFLGSIPNLRGKYPEGGQDLPPLFLFPQPHEMTCDSTAT
ncbi:hypothetical protein TNCV_3776441 [Trichonephila clavipes]|nr:hypothetical protein TNCV_3776441 [Trichonephila clavipes]